MADMKLLYIIVIFFAQPQEFFWCPSVFIFSEGSTIAPSIRWHEGWTLLGRLCALTSSCPRPLPCFRNGDGRFPDRTMENTRCQRLMLGWNIQQWCPTMPASSRTEIFEIRSGGGGLGPRLCERVEKQGHPENTHTCGW